MVVVSTSGPADPPSVERTLQPGDELAKRFKLLARLGQGGNGEVWKALNLRLGFKVAIKIPTASTLTADDLERFRREARALCLINNEHVLRFFEYDDVHTPFLVMELLKGEDLAARLKRENLLPLADVKDICKQICQGLKAAHDNGVIHRDIKPANIYCHDGKVKIVDFGLMKLVTPAKNPITPQIIGPHAELTKRGTAVGTPPYMSPEQWTLTEHDVCFQSDLWSLAITLYKLLTGQLPFVAATDGELFRLISTATAPRASVLRSTLPAELDRFFDKALQKDPSKRFATAAELAAAFEALPEERSSSATTVPPGASEPAGAEPATTVKPGRLKVTPPLETNPTTTVRDGPTRGVAEAPPARRRRAAIVALLATGAVAMLGGIGIVRPDLVLRCTGGTRNCDGSLLNGCETSIETVEQCGGCGHRCTNDHGATSCVAATCAPACAAGFGDCDGDPANGCERELTAPESCGECGQRCVNGHGAAACVAGRCAPACAAGFGDCDGDPANGCEADLTSPESCGVCGSRRCESLASGSVGALDLAVDAAPEGNVYWTNPLQRTVQMVGKGGSGAATVYTGGGPTNIFVDGSSIYWADPPSRRAWKREPDSTIPKPVGTVRCSGCELTSLALYGGSAHLVIRDGATAHTEIWSMKTKSKVIETSDPIIDPFAFVIGSRGAFWIKADTGDVASLWTAVPRATDPPRQIITARGKISALALDPRGEIVYWAQKDDTGKGLIVEATYQGTSRKILARGDFVPRRIAADEATVYWTTAEGAVMKPAIEAGADPIVLAAGQDGPAGIAVDAQHVYWVNERSGQVMKVAKKSGDVR